MQEVNIITRHDRSEKVQYNTADFPAYIRCAALSQYPNYAAVSHWHDDIELIAVHSGHMRYNVNGNIISIQEGEGIFVNARQLHYGFSEDKSECTFVCVLFHPMLLCSSRYIEETFVLPVLRNEKLPYYHLRRQIEWEAFILDKLQSMNQLLPSPAFELKIQSLLFDIWSEIYIHQKVLEKPFVRSHHLSALRDMVSYIQSNYKEKISLSELAAVGCVGKTSCCTIFRQYTNQTPNAYMTDYRLQKSVDLLTGTDMTITEICFEVGFSGASYFTETFRKSFNCSPKEYRARYKLGLL